MPEGPEIRRAADQIAQSIGGKTVLRLEFGLPHLKEREHEFTGRRVASVKTYGKAMVTRFDDVTTHTSLSIYTHNQLYGRWVCCPAHAAPASTRQLRLGIYTVDKWALLYSASDIVILNDDELDAHPFLKKLGKDVLDPGTQAADIRQQLLSPAYVNRQLGGFLTEQSFVAGLGNYLRCEILFVAGIHPVRKPAELSKAQISTLADTILTIARQAYQTESITHDLKAVTQLMNAGQRLEDSRFWVFRREGLPCYRCGTIISKQKNGGQPCYICKTCQN